MFKVGGGFKGGKPLRPPYLLHGLQAEQVELQEERERLEQWLERLGKSSPENDSARKGS